MMLRRVLLLASCAGLLGLASAHAETRVLRDIGLEDSEAARHDAAGDRYLVSNLGAGARGPTNNGFITVIAPSGEVVSLKWAAGGVDDAVLHDPLGLIIAGDVVYVADTTAVRRFDRKSGRMLGSVEVPGAVRLNDLAMGPDGTLYVTDSGSDDTPGAIFKISRDGKVSVFAARSEALERPNGIAVMADGTIVHGGRGVNLVFRSPDGRILRERTLPTGQVDGVVPLEDGSLLVASQLGKTVYRLPPTGKAKAVASDIEVPAAIGYDARRKRLLVPQIRASSVTLVDLTD